MNGIQQSKGKQLLEGYLAALFLLWSFASSSYLGSTSIETLSVYDGAERAIAMRDERGHWSRTVYDDANRTTRNEDEVTALDGSKQLLTSTTVLDDDGRTAYTLDPQQTRTKWRYDDAGRVLETHLDVRYNSQTGARTIYARSQTSYDVLGRATKETNPSNQWKSYDYDSLGRLRAVMQPQDGNAARNMITRFGYDEAGLKLWQQDAKGYDEDGRPALTAAPQARVTRFGYDVAGRSIARQMPELVDNKYLIERTGYDELGRVDSHTDFRGFTSTMSYDVRGRMLSKVPDSRLNEKGLYMGYPDEFTTVASRGNGAGALVTTSISDTQRGWLQSVTSPTGTLTYGYDVGGNRTSVTHTRGSESFTTNYAYDELSRLTKVSDGDDELARIGYDLKGNREQVLRANGVATGYQFDSLNRLKKLTHAKGQTVLSSFDYTVRQDGKRTGVSESVVNDQTAATPRTSSRDVGFTYDDAGRLTKESGADGLGVSYENAWQYDAAGNRAVTTYKRATVEAPNTVATTTTIAAVFSGNDWLKEQTSTVKTAAATSATTTFYGYDRNGAQTNERVGAAGAVEVNEWQFDGTLASTVTQGQATGGSEFVYDAGGNRLKQRTQIGKPEAKEVRYLVDPNTSYAQVVQERDENNVLQARYAWEDGLAPLVMWRRTDSGAYAAFFYLCDGQDSVRQLTDATGRVTDSYFYDAFGNALQGGSGDTPNTFRYTGQQLDPSNNYYLRARYYNTGSGRFSRHDSVMGVDQDPATLHRYTYSMNDGANYRDPSGNFSSFSEASITAGLQFSLNALKTASYSTLATAATSMVTMAFFNRSFMAHMESSKGSTSKMLMPDGIFVTGSANLNLSKVPALKAGASFMIYMNFEKFKETGSLYFYLTGEVGIQPGIPSNDPLISFSGGLGATYNNRDISTGASNPGKMEGPAFNSTSPASFLPIIAPGLVPHAHALAAVGNHVSGHTWFNSSFSYTYGRGDGEFGSSALTYSPGLSMSSTFSFTRNLVAVSNDVSGVASSVANSLGISPGVARKAEKMMQDAERELTNASQS